MADISLPSPEDLKKLDELLQDVDIKVAQSMAYIKKVQKWTFGQLFTRFDDIKLETLKKYMQASYKEMRPIHFIAAYSWITMVPMTSFFKGLKVIESDRGMDESSIEAIIQCGRLSTKRFQITLDYIYDHLAPEEKARYDDLCAKVFAEHGRLDDYDDSQFLPPETLSLMEFGEDYYYSIALALKDFRKLHGLSANVMAQAMGLSLNRYQILEDPERKKVSSPFSLHMGVRVRVAFRSHSHVEFTKYMKRYPQFHQLRKVQHIRDALIVEGLRYVPQERKKSIIEIMNILARN